MRNLIKTTFSGNTCTRVHSSEHSICSVRCQNSNALFKSHFLYSRTPLIKQPRDISLSPICLDYIQQHFILSLMPGEALEIILRINTRNPLSYATCYSSMHVKTPGAYYFAMNTRHLCELMQIKLGFANMPYSHISEVIKALHSAFPGILIHHANENSISRRMISAFIRSSWLTSLPIELIPLNLWKDLYSALSFLKSGTKRIAFSKVLLDDSTLGWWIALFIQRWLFSLCWKDNLTEDMYFSHTLLSNPFLPGSICLKHGEVSLFPGDFYSRHSLRDRAFALNALISSFYGPHFGHQSYYAKRFIFSAMRLYYLAAHSKFPKQIKKHSFFNQKIFKYIRIIFNKSNRNSILHSIYWCKLPNYFYLELVRYLVGMHSETKWIVEFKPRYIRALHEMGRETALLHLELLLFEFTEQYVFSQPISKEPIWRYNSFHIQYK